MGLLRDHPHVPDEETGTGYGWEVGSREGLAFPLFFISSDLILLSPFPTVLFQKKHNGEKLKEFYNEQSYTPTPIQQLFMLCHI